MRTQGTILSSFLFGYALVLVPAELYLKRVVDKLILIAVLLINGGLAAAMPTIVNKVFSFIFRDLTDMQLSEATCEL